MTDLATLLEDADEQLAPLEQAYALAEWDVALEASDSREQALVDASLAYDRALADPDRFQALVDAAGNGASLGDVIARRRLTLLRAAAEGRQRPPELAERILRLEAALSTLYSTHRGRIGGREVSQNDIEEILAASTDHEERRAAWEASKQIGAHVAPQVRELARLRNEAARQLGYRDHFEMSLTLDELDEDWLLAFLDRLDTLLEPTWTREKDTIDAERRQILGLADDVPLRPWDYADAYFQEAPPVPGDGLNDALRALDPVAVSRAYFAALGDPIGDILDRSDLYPRPRKNQHAFCIQIQRGEDVRILANIVPGERWLGTMLHELGHAAYDVAIDASLPWLLREPSHTFTTEAIAMLHGRRARDAVFLGQFADLDAAAAGDPVHETVLRRALLVFVPWVQVMTRFEQLLYADPEADLGAIWWDLVERYQRVTPPDGPRPDDWAVKNHVALAPVYYQNYLLGEVTASQLEWALGRETGDTSPAANPAAAGRFLRDRFMLPGASLRWDELVERATGQALTPDHFAAQLSG